MKSYLIILIKHLIVLNKRINYCGREYYVTNAIQVYLDKIFGAIEQKNFIASIIYQFE